jgi:predicted nucleic acid-binding protein
VIPVFVDTSALLALLSSSDANHTTARRAFRRLGDREARLLTTSYVLVETYALLGRRLGVKAVRAFRESFEPLLQTVWIDRETHEGGLDLLLTAPRRKLSLVDATSFLVARAARVEEVFAFDVHFQREGFRLVR